MYFVENDEYYMMSLKALEQLFAGTGVSWSNWIQKDIIDYKERGSVKHHLQAYGGMGSINDIWITTGNHHRITKEAEPWANELMSYLLGISARLAHMIEGKKKIQPEKLFGKNQQTVPLQGWRCLFCGYGELSKNSLDNYLAQLMLPDIVREFFSQGTIEELICMCLEVKIPQLKQWREELTAIALKSGVAIAEHTMRPCVKCKGNDTAVYHWELQEQRGRFGKKKQVLLPAENNLKLRGK